jgi:hypothetical protein
MATPNSVDVVKDKMLQAERALADYFQSHLYDPDEERRLADAAKAARQEYVSQLSNPWPGRYSQGKV